MIVAPLAQWRRNFRAPEWQRAFEFLETLGFNTEDTDRIEILGQSIFARVMSYATKPAEECILEAHDKYIDIQMSLRGTEAIGVYPRRDLRIKTPYDPERDAVFFEHAEMPATRIVNAPGQFTVLFPEDAHMSQMTTDKFPQSVKKVVIKVNATLPLF